MKRITVVQARLGSTRLPGKCLLPLGKTSVLVEMCLRVERAKTIGQLVVATTENRTDDRLVDECREHGIEVFRGDAENLLDRHYRAMLHYGADEVVKIPSDCPLIDPCVIDAVLSAYSVSGADYFSNLHPPTYPDGNDVEVMTRSALTRAWREAERDFEREHTTPYFWGHPGEFRVGNFVWDSGRDLSQSHRWVLDYPEDYALIRAVHNELSAEGVYGVERIVALIDERPDLARLNAKYLGDGWWLRHAEELSDYGGKA
jgi:spore coat polysaccharide biosynthesis protein SpsF